MDILHRKLYKKGDTVYFIRASIENPFLYLRFKGKVMDVIVQGESITYHIKVLQVIEKYNDVMLHLSRVRFRVRASKINRYLDKKVYTLEVREETYSDDFCKHLEHYLFDMPSLLVFETREEMETNLQKLNNKLLKDLGRFTALVQARTI